jgi:hypothetical protein
MFMDAIGSATQKGTKLKNAIFGLVVMVVKISVAALIVFGITYLSDRSDPKPGNTSPQHSLDTSQGQ